MHLSPSHRPADDAFHRRIDEKQKESSDTLRFLFVLQRREGHHDAGGLRGVRSAPCAHVKVRFRDAEFLDEDITHAVIVMLAGMHQAPVEDVFVLAEDGRYLHEVGAGGHGVVLGFGAG